MSKQGKIKEHLVELFEQTDFSKETPAQLADAVLWVENELGVVIKVAEISGKETGCCPHITLEPLIQEGE